MTRLSLARSAACLAAIAALTAGCGDSAPEAKVPPRPTAAPTPYMPPSAQIGISDAPSSRPGDTPDTAPRPAMNSQAAALYQQALGAFANGELVQAKVLFTQATQADPSAHQAFYSLGTVQDRLRDPGAAQSYRQAFTIVPDYEPAILAYAMSLAKKGNLGDADRFLTDKLGQMPRSAAVTATLAEVKSLQKDTGSAQRLAQDALKLNPDYRPAMVIIARDHYRNRRLDLALYALQAILDGFEPVAENPPRDKDNAEARLLRGLIWREQGLRAGAMDEFRKAVERRPDMVEARVQLGTFLLESGSAQEAWPLLEGAVKFDGDHLPARLALGDAYRLLGRSSDAKRELEWVIARDANVAQAHYDLGLLYLFAPSLPGMTPKQQVGQAVTALKRYQELRQRGDSDDSDELLNRAKLKEAEIDAASQAAQPAAAEPAPGATPTAPAASAAPDAGAPPPPAAGDDGGDEP
jgi:tetratricopeptide (TPR) repeat protein